MLLRVRVDRCRSPFPLSYSTVLPILKIQMMQPCLARYSLCLVVIKYLLQHLCHLMFHLLNVRILSQNLLNNSIAAKTFSTFEMAMHPSIHEPGFPLVPFHGMESPCLHNWATQTWCFRPTRHVRLDRLVHTLCSTAPTIYRLMARVFRLAFRILCMPNRCPNLPAVLFLQVWVLLPNL